jgi:hypothetical protein
LYEDDETTGRSNPLTTDSNGRYYFNATNAVYDIDVVSGGVTTTMTKMQLDAVEGAVGRLVVAANDEATARTALGLGSSATMASSSFLGTGLLGAANGVAPLDADAKVPLINIPVIAMGSNTTRYDLAPKYDMGDGSTTPKNVATRQPYTQNSSFDCIGEAGPFSTQTVSLTALTLKAKASPFGAPPDGSSTSEYITIPGDPGITMIPAGTWRFKNLYAYLTGISGGFNGTVLLTVQASRVNSAGVFQEIIAEGNAQISATSIPTVTAALDFDVVTTTDTAMAVDDRISFKVGISCSGNTALGTFSVRFGATNTPPDDPAYPPYVAHHVVVEAPIFQSPLIASKTISGNPGASPAMQTAMTGAQAADIVAPSLMFGLRNKIINGCFRKWDYATSQTADGYGSDNRWVNANNGTTKTHALTSFSPGQTDVPGNPVTLSRTTVTSVAGAANYCYKEQRIEGVNTGSGVSVTVSFWAKADANKSMSLELVQIFGSGGSSYVSVSPVKLALTSSWAKYEYTFDVPSISGKTVGAGDYLAVRFWFDAGSDYNSRTVSLGQQSGTFDIAQVQLEEGSVATPFEQRPMSLEEMLCYRYLPIISNYTTYTTLPAVGLAGSTTKAYLNVPFMVPARVKTTGISISAASDFRVSDFSSPAVCSGVAHYDASAIAASLDITVASGLTQWRPYILQSANATTAKILFTGAEL